MSTMLRKMEMSDVSHIVAIHYTSWRKSEISVKLGIDYLAKFYENVVQSPYSFAYVYDINNKIVAYATGFYDYHNFNRYFRDRILFGLFIILITRFVRGKIGLPDILNLINDKKKLKKAKYPMHHLGALALSNDFKGSTTGKRAIRETINAVIGELERQGYDGCWGLCEDQNWPMRKYLLKLGFDSVDEIKLIGKKVVLFEKSFNNYNCW